MVSTREHKFLISVGAIGLLTLLAYFAWTLRRIDTDPTLVFLRPSGAATWIVGDDPVRLQGQPAAIVTNAFQTSITITHPPASAVLRVRALGELNVRVDGNLIHTGIYDGETRWKTEQTVQLVPVLTPGPHTFTLFVRNQNGPVAVWAECAELGLRTDDQWQQTSDGVTWKKARSAEVRGPPEFSRQFERADRAFVAKLPFFGALFAAVVATFLWDQRRAEGALKRISPETVRWFLLAAFAVLGLNNFHKLNPFAGPDAIAHAEYFTFLINQGRIPYANEGWQMFQSPLYYLINAPLLWLLTKITSTEAALQWLRLIPVLCGLAQIEISFRALQLAMPGRRGLQILGTVFAALLPMNLYAAQFLGNEPLAGCLSSAVLLHCFKLLRTPGAATRRSHLLWMGLFLGLALLTKVSTLMVAGPLLFLFAQIAIAENPEWRGAIRQFTTAGVCVFGVAAMVGGWYYLRNWIHLGKPFVGGWDASRGIVWTQDPGFRSPADFLSFGTVFVRPIFASVVGLWDGLYASFWCDTFVGSAIVAEALPGWNFGFLHSSVWLALVPSTALAIGIAGAWSWSPDHPERRLRMFAVLALATFALIFLEHYLTIPFYGVVKATYTLGLMPCYIVLAAAGFDVLTRHRVIRPIVLGAFVCWAVSVYGAYFII